MQSSQSHPLSLSYREFKSRDENLEGLELGKYTVMRELGKGSFGKVYEATNKSGGSFAVKLLDKKEAREEPNPRVKAIRERLIESQPRLMRQCHSPNLIKLLDVFENDDLKILIIEFCDGRTLADQLKQRSDRRFSEKEAVDIIRHIINGIAELHRHSIVHRDLKTDNVMQHEGIYKIIDFGFSKKLELSFESEQTKNTVLGTPTTMAPEVMAHQRYGLKADIWSIGIIFFQIVLGYSPYNSNSAKTFYTHIEGRFSSQIPDFTQNGVTLSPQAYDFLKSALKVDPDTRIGWREMVQHPLIKIRPEEPITGRFTERHNMTVPPVAEELAKGSLILTQIEIGVQEIQMKKQPQEAAGKSKENLPRNQPAAKKQRQAAQRQEQSVKKQGYAQKQEQGARGAQKQAEKQAIRAVPKRTNRFDLEKMMEREEEAERLKKVNDRRESQRKLLQMEEFKPRQSGRKHSHQRDTSAHTQRHFVQANLTINEADQSQQLSTVLFKLQGEVQPKRKQALDSEYVGCLKLHLECLKTEFVLNQIFTPIQEKDLLDLNKRVSVEFMHLLISRCFKNLSPLKEKLRQNPQHVHRAFRNLYKQVEHLHCRVAEKFQQYDQKLLSIENKYMEIGKDLLLKVLQGGSEKEKNKIIGGVELREDKPASQFGDFTKAQQIAFTSLYIQKLLPSISYEGPCPTRLLQFLRFYGLIMNVTLESLGDESFSEFVRRITI